MDVDRASLVDAISGPMSLAHGQHAAFIMENLPKGQAVSLDLAGCIVAASLAELPPATALATIDRLKLVGANATFNKAYTWLDAAAVMSHPALVGCVADSIGGQIAVMLRAAANLNAISISQPVFGAVTTVQVGQELETVVVDLTFPQTNGFVSLQFGKRMEPAHHRVCCEMSGDAILGIGLELKEDSPQAPPMDADSRAQLH